MALREQIKAAVDKHSGTVGLAENGSTRFECGTCEYYDASQGGYCQNKHPKLLGKHVETNWCCNLYDHADMKVIIA